MPSEKYIVLIDGNVVADCMPLNYAMLFVKSLFTEYYNDYKMVVEIKQMERCQPADIEAYVDEIIKS